MLDDRTPWGVGRLCPPPGFVNKVLLPHGSTHSFIHCSRSLLLCYNGKIEQLWQRPPGLQAYVKVCQPWYVSILRCLKRDGAAAFSLWSCCVENWFFFLFSETLAWIWTQLSEYVQSGNGAQAADPWTIKPRREGLPLSLPGERAPDAVDSQPAPRPLLRQGLAECWISVCVLFASGTWMNFGSLNRKYLYLKWKWAKMNGAGEFCMFFSFGQMFVAVLLDPCWCLEGHLGPWNGIFRGTGERQFPFRVCSLLECRVGSSQSLLREQRQTEYRARVVLEPWRWAVCHAAASPRRGLSPVRWPWLRLPSEWDARATGEGLASSGSRGRGRGDRVEGSPPPEGVKPGVSESWRRIGQGWRPAIAPEGGQELWAGISVLLSSTTRWLCCWVMTVEAGG